MSLRLCAFASLRWVFALLLWGSVVVVHAQTDLSEVYVTTQRNVSLRAGPGTNWERLAVIPYGVTLRATGRTLEADWVQVAYEGTLDSDRYPEATINGVTYGWVKTSLTFWTGSIMQLPIDGVPTVNFVRDAPYVIVITPDMPIYTGVAIPETRVPYPLETIARVEATGRWGDPPYNWYQFKARGEFYWVSSLSIGGAATTILPDAALLVSSGRLSALTYRALNRLDAVLSETRSRWNALAAGAPTTCNNVPGEFSLNLYTENDLNSEPVYNAMLAALLEAETATESALERLRQACANPSAPISGADIEAALADIAAAYRAREFVILLLPSNDS